MKKKVYQVNVQFYRFETTASKFSAIAVAGRYHRLFTSKRKADKFVKTSSEAYGKGAINHASCIVECPLQELTSGNSFDHVAYHITEERLY